MHSVQYLEDQTLSHHTVTNTKSCRLRSFRNWTVMQFGWANCMCCDPVADDPECRVHLDFTQPKKKKKNLNVTPLFVYALASFCRQNYCIQIKSLTLPFRTFTASAPQFKDIINDVIQILPQDHTTHPKSTCVAKLSMQEICQDVCFSTIQIQILTAQRFLRDV